MTSPETTARSGSLESLQRSHRDSHYLRPRHASYRCCNYYSLASCSLTYDSWKELITRAVLYYQIQFKIALLMYNALAGRCPEYINDIVAPVASNPGRDQLRSAARSDVIVPRCTTKFGSRAFSVAGPEMWNRLPQSIRSADTVRQFRRLLKTHYFQLHFGPN